MAGKSIFIDSNILVYANNDLSSFCKPARTKLQATFANYDSVWINCQVIREFSVIATREMLNNSGKVDYLKLQKSIDQFNRDFQIADDDTTVTETLFKLMKATNTSGKQIHDANIIATMQVNGIDDLLTNNIKDFKRFSHLVNVISLV